MLLGIAKHLDICDLYNIASLNKFIRYRCLTTQSFQNIVRAHLFKTWAAPTPPEDVTHAPDAYPEIFPHPTARGDWLLYGQRVFQSDSMRNRRRIFKIIEQLQRQYVHNATQSGYLSGTYAEQKQAYVRAIVEQQLLLKDLQLYDFNVFMQALTILNKACEADLRRPKFRGNKLPQAVEKVKGLIVGNSVRSSHRSRLDRHIEQRIMSKITERMGLVMEEKKRDRRPRTAGSKTE